MYLESKESAYGSILGHDFQVLELYSVLEEKAGCSCLYLFLGNSSHECIRVGFRLQAKGRYLA